MSKTREEVVEEFKIYLENRECHGCDTDWWSAAVILFERVYDLELAQGRVFTLSDFEKLYEKWIKND